MDEMEQSSSFNQLAEMIYRHEEKSQHRYEDIKKELSLFKERNEGQDMSDGINTDKVVVNAGSGGEGGGSQAAMIAALLNGRNQDPGMYAAMMNQNGGMNALWPILVLLGLGGGGFGDRFGRKDGCNEVSPAQAAMLQTLLNGQSDLRAQVGTTALETQNSFLSELSRLALGTQAGFTNLGDKMQNVGTVIATAIGNVNQNVLEEGCKTRAAVAASETAILERISRFEIDGLRHERDRFERQVEIAALNSRVEVNQTVNTIAAANAQQSQVQFQFQDINNKIDRLCSAVNSVANQVQVARNFQDVNNFGTMVASATQTPTTTQVR